MLQIINICLVTSRKPPLFKRCLPLSWFKLRFLKAVFSLFVLINCSWRVGVDPSSDNLRWPEPFLQFLCTPPCLQFFFLRFFTNQAVPLRLFFKTAYCRSQLSKLITAKRWNENKVHFKHSTGISLKLEKTEIRLLNSGDNYSPKRNVLIWLMKLI